MVDQSGVKIRGVADIVFLVDSTGSMKPCIDQLKSSIGEFCRQLSSGNQAVDWRARVVGFRDRDEDGADWMVGEQSAMIATEAELGQQLEALVASGGGDDPESGLDALLVAGRDTPWRPIGTAHRLVVVLTDQPPKPTLHADTVPSGEANDVMAVGQFLASEHVKVLIWAPACHEWDLLGKIPGSQFHDVSAGGNVYAGLANVSFPDVYQSIARTVSTPAPAGQ